MSKITRVTLEQEKLLADQINYWLKVGRSTERLDRAAVTEAICAMYQAISKERPAVLFFSSPVMCLLARAALRELASKAPALGSQLDSQLWSQLRSQLRSQLDSQLWSQLGSQLRSQLDSQLRSQLRSQLGSQLANYCAGSWWCAWEVFYAYCNRIGVTYTNEQKAVLALWQKQSRECHWWFPYEGIVFASERPTVIALDERGRLHSEHGQALEYSDGYGFCALHGVRVDERIVKEPSSITVKEIEGSTNQELRRVLTARYGTARYLKDSGAVLQHEDKRGKLWRKARPGDTDLVMVEVLNSTPEPDGSTKTYHLRVPPEIKTATAAIAWTFGLKSAQYRPGIET